MFLTACGSDHKNSVGGTGGIPGEAGSGGGGADGGSGGSGGDDDPEPETPKVTCGGVRVIDLDGAESPAVLHDKTDTLDHWTSRCTPPDSVGNDVAIRFHAGAAGTYLFSTEGTGFDTMVYAFADCMDGFSELACRAKDSSSRISLRLDAGQIVYVIVDSMNVRESRPFTLTATRVTAPAPVIDKVEAYYTGTTGATAIRLTGRNPGSPLDAINMDIWGAAQKITTYSAFFDDPGSVFRVVSEEGGTFVVEGAFTFPTSAGRIARVDMSVIDENGQASEIVSERTAGLPRRMRGEACDPRKFFDECDSPNVCFVQPPATVPTCQMNTPPVLDSAVVTVNYETGYWGIVVEGRDADSNAAFLRVTPRKNLTSQYIGDGPALIPFRQITYDGVGNFRGVVSLAARFDGPCLAPAQAKRDSCEGRGTAPQTCYDSFVAELNQCYRDVLSLITRVDVEVIDWANAASALIKVTPIAEAPAVEEGDLCDPHGATGACPDELLCWAEQPGDAEVCRANTPVCPANYGVIDLMAHASGAKWVYRGNNSAAARHGAASCGGGGPSDVLAFTAPSAATYRFVTSDLGEKVDTVVSLRPFCQLDGYEHVCNNRALITNPGSQVEATLAQGETVYILVDSALGAATGNYTLTVSR
ncbi:hypothetical protein AKJ08_1932 [Vulgatibacter incomptus]|uniref:Uncharacterized protein n=1 Tax=Vulgatibacter incomptus TaxID=1391653 RepID=A0A0K1PDE7_9BACT|nr:hypothetical protein AKJ08_1932 [Vulgatibacter incomptus]